MRISDLSSYVCSSYLPSSTQALRHKPQASDHSWSRSIRVHMGMTQGVPRLPALLIGGLESSGIPRANICQPRLQSQKSLVWIADISSETQNSDCTNQRRSEERPVGKEWVLTG